MMEGAVDAAPSEPNKTKRRLSTARNENVGRLSLHTPPQGLSKGPPVYDSPACGTSIKSGMYGMKNEDIGVSSTNDMMLAIIYL